MRLIGACLLAGALLAQPQLDFLNRNRSLLDAHNCYPELGQWADRIERALKLGFPVAIEQDLALSGGRAVLCHNEKPAGGEPTLREHFFERVRPMMEKALKENDRARWPLIVLHFDFKSLEPELLRDVWKLLGEYESWLTTAAKTSDPRQLAPFDARPLLVLTEDADAQEDVFFRAVPAGGKLRVFGSARKYPIHARSDQERWHMEATLAPAQLLSEPPTNYRRWWNNSWHAVEEGGQQRAGEWTAADEQRLRALVGHAHKLGYWIRFFTLDGYTPAEDRGWTRSYNFGSHAAVEARWQAAMEAGVDLIATDQYEEMAAFMRQRRVR